MRKLSVDQVERFVSENIGTFHTNKLHALQSLNLKRVLRAKNPYLFKAKNILVASDLITQILDAYLSSSEEKIFGDFLEDLALFIVEQTYDGKPSGNTGIDFEFVDDKNVLHLVSVKSGPNWGNSSQTNKLQADFERAINVIRRRVRRRQVQAVLGICYGRTRTSHLRNYMKVVGQNFWYLISGNKNLYVDIIKPLGHEARKHNKNFCEQKAAIVNRFTAEFCDDFCIEGKIDWERIVRFNSGNLDLE